jgi:DNA-binding CsgD family transcriptional regulator
MIAEHHTNKSIASTLGLAEKTVEYHLRNLFKKLGVRSRKEVGSWWLGRMKGSVAQHHGLN